MANDEYRWAQLWPKKSVGSVIRITRYIFYVLNYLRYDRDCQSIFGVEREKYIVEYIEMLRLKVIGRVRGDIAIYICFKENLNRLKRHTEIMYGGKL